MFFYFVISLVKLLQLQNLQFLSLRNNKLSFLHPDVGRLKPLLYLDAAGKYLVYEYLA